MRRLLVALVAAASFACPPMTPEPDAGTTGGGASAGGSAGGVAGGTAGGSAGGAAGGSAGGSAGGAAGGLAGGSAGGAAGGSAGGVAGSVLRRSSRSTTVQVTGDDSLVAMVNPDVGTVSFFNAATKSKSGSASFGATSQPEGVAIHPNDTTAFVLLRRAQRLAKVTAINTTSPQVDATRATTGSEPTGVALSPTGATAVVANHGDRSVTFIDTATMSVIGTTPLAAAPRALAITNDGDTDDADERIFVTLFFGDAVAEASDTGRIGKVVELSASTRAVVRTIDLMPFSDTGFSTTALSDGGFALPHVACSPNQLFGITINGTRAYVPNVCASPQGPVNKFTNLFAAVSVIDLTTNQEDRGPTGSAVISKLAQEQGGPTSSLLGVPVGITFVDGTNVGYLVSQAADVVQRIHYNQAIARGPIALGRDATFEQISLRGAGGTKVPSGVVAGHANGTLYVNNQADRSLTLVNLANQAVDPMGDGLASEPKPTTGTPEFRVLQGFKFFFTGTGRWSDRGVNSCGSCHPDGLTDNLTWIFAAGPRQSTALDGMYGKRTPGDQRVLNWTGIFDEMHDFELNTRGTAGGKGAITEGTAPNDTPFNLTNGVQLPGFNSITRNDFLSGSTRAVVATRAALRDWDEIDDYAKTIRSNRAPTSVDAGAVLRGSGIFQANNCHYCHGGQKWTASQLPYTPSPDKNGSLPGVTGGPDAGTGLRTQTLDAGTGFAGRNTDALKVDIERGLALGDGGVVNVGPERVTCVLRDVGTFVLADPIERKADGSPAQGFKGFNPPALTSVATGAPFLHHGKARTLAELFTPPYANHYQAGSANFLANGGTTPMEQQQIADLIAFLESIDESTPPFTIPPNQNLCVGY